MRLCFQEGRFLVDVYDALNERMSWEEVERIQVCSAVINDERADFNHWHSKNHERAEKLRDRKYAQAVDGEPQDGERTIEQLQLEFDENKQGLANAQADLRKHREALAHGRGEEDGRMPPDQVEFVQAVSDAHASKIDLLEAVIMERFENGDAKLDGG